MLYEVSEGLSFSRELKLYLMKSVPFCDADSEQLIIRYTYGAVVDEINDAQVSEIVVPLLNDENVQRKINDTVLEANQKRTEVYNLEQEALRVLDEKVIYAR